MNTINKIIKNALNNELKRQQNHIELIASENYASEAVMTINGSILTNKYAEGYPKKRYYGGCEYIDEIESLGIETAKKLFGADHVNIQPHSGSQANEAAYRAVLKTGDKVVAMSLNAGGHLTHGFNLNFSGELYNFAFYGVNKKTEQLDYKEIEEIVLKHQPKLIVAGASAYSRFIDFKKFREIADKVNALLMVDMAHIAGLVAGNVHPNPVLYADIVTTTTHKTLRGSRGGIILCKEKLAKKIDSSVFPGTQGGPLENQIGGKTQALLEASTKEFKIYAQQIVKNSKSLAESLRNNGVRIITGGTDNHLINFEVKETFKMTGRKAEEILESIGIITNKELLPFDVETPFNTSGIRVGTPAMTTRGLKEKDFTIIGEIIVSALKDNSEKNLINLRTKVQKICNEFPIYKNLCY